MKPHKHAELIKAWADGVEIQFKRPEETKWQDAGHNPSWYDCFEYRIKPQAPKPDFVRYACYDIDKNPIENIKEKEFRFYLVEQILEYHPDIGQLKIIFDGETNKIKSAEVL